MRIAFVSTYDSSDLRAASYTFYVARCLTEASHSLIRIGPLGNHARWWRTFKGRFYRHLLGQRYHPDRDPRLARGYGREVAARLDEVQPDLIFATETVPLSYLETEKPIVFWADATFSGLLNFYEYYTDPCPETIRTGIDLENKALARAALALYASDWAAQSAIRDHGADPAKVHVVPWGANIDSQRTPEDIERLLDARAGPRCQLLFVGVEWERKGAPLAVEVARWLNAHGVPTDLTMVGCLPPPGTILPEFVHTLGFISKTEPAGRQRLDELYAAAHFLIVPSRAECYGVVFAEANSFGVPSLATAVGGIPTVVINDVNGRAFPLAAEAGEYGASVAALMADEPRYRALARSSFQQYQERFNWEVAGRTVNALLARLGASKLS